MTGPPEMLEAVEGDSARPQRVPNFVEREKSRARPCSVLRPMRLQEVLGTEKMLAFYEAAWPADTPMPPKIIGNSSNPPDGPCTSAHPDLSDC